jgi:hypothetical protein
MRVSKSPSIRIVSRVAFAAAPLFGAVPTASAQSTEHLVIGFAQGASQAVPLSPGLTVAIAPTLVMTAFVILRRRAVRGRLFGWLLAVSAATLAVVGGERVISEAQAILPPAAITLSVSPGTLDLLTYWNSNIDPLTVTVTNATGQSVRITSVAVDNTNLYGLSTPTTCVVGLVLAPNSQCTVTLSIE